MVLIYQALSSGPISTSEKKDILFMLGRVAQEKYDEFIVQGGRAKGYNLESFKGYLKFKPDPVLFDNDYWLEGPTKDRTEIAEFFEYGTGLYNSLRAGQYRAGYIRPVTKKYMKFKSSATGNWTVTDKVRGVQPIFAMTKALKFIEFHRIAIQRHIRLDIQKNSRLISPPSGELGGYYG